MTDQLLLEARTTLGAIAPSGVTCRASDGWASFETPTPPRERVKSNWPHPDQLIWPHLSDALSAPARTRCVRLKDWKWNRETRRWELVETGEELTAADAVDFAPLPVLFIIAVPIAIARLLVKRRRKRRASRASSQS